ncbi:hypothetical protein V8C35DRAFT_305856 [Trichoderma chlorosporum]
MELVYAGLRKAEQGAKRVNIKYHFNIVSDPVETEWADMNFDSFWSSPESDVGLVALITQSPSLNSQALRLAPPIVPVPAWVLDCVAASLEDFEALWRNDAGSATLLDGPRRLFMQTPNDGQFFCSMMVRSHGGGHKDRPASFRAIIISSDPAMNTPRIAQSFRTPTWWAYTDLPVVFLPLEFLIRHIRQVSESLAELTIEVSCIEEIVINDEISPSHSSEFSSTFKALIKRLHICSREAVKLHRRWHFQMMLAKTIVDLIEIHGPQAVPDRHSRDKVGDIASTYEYQQLLNAASFQHKLSQSLEYDINVLPTRIANQSTAIFNLMAQSDTQASMSIAVSSRKDNEYMQAIADATLQDSSSMKTIAILTMVFLPGTFICSFFSMTMFNWNSQPGEPLVSPYIWAYFVAMIPLTVLVIAIWWWKTKESRRVLEEAREKQRLARGNTIKV